MFRMIPVWGATVDYPKGEFPELTDSVRVKVAGELRTLRYRAGGERRLLNARATQLAGSPIYGRALLVLNDKDPAP